MASEREIDRLQVVITAQTENFTKQMNAVNTKLDALKDTTTSMGASVSGFQGAMTKASIAANIVTGVLRKSLSVVTQVAGSVFNLTKQLAENGSQYSRIKVATDTVTRNLGMTREEVDGLRDSLAESNTYGTKAEEVIKTLAMSGLVDMANGMKVVKAGTDETIEGVGALVYEMKDLAAAAGIESAEGIDRVTKFIRRGEATFADGIIEIGNLAGEYSAYATALGKTASQLTAQERAQVRLNIVNREAEKVYGAYANTMQTSAKAWDSTRAVIRTTMETLGGYLEPIFSVLANGLYQIANGFRNALKGSENSIKEWAIKVAGFFVAVIRVIGQLLSRIPLIGKYFTGMANFSVKPLSKISGGADKASDSIAGIGDSAASTAKQLDKLAGFDEMNVLDQESGSGSSGGFSAGEAGGGFGIDTLSLEDSSNKINEIADNLTGKWGDVSTKIKDAFQPIVTLWEKWVIPAWKGFIAVFEDFLKMLGINSIQDFITLVGVVLVAAIGAVINVITGAITIIKTIIDWAHKAYDAVYGVFEKLMLNIMGMNDRIYKAFESAILSIVDWVRNAVSNVTTWVNNAKNTVVSTATNIWNSIKNTFSSVGSWFSNIFNTAVNGIRNAFNSIPSFFSGIWSRIKTTFGEIGTKAGELVGGAFKTVINSVLSKVSNVINTPINAINKLINKINTIPSINLSTLGNVYIPQLATGGVIDSPTVALLGEAGREAVVPLENTSWIDELAEKISNTSGNQSITVKIGEETVYSGFVDYLNDKSMRTGTKLLNI